MEKFLHSWAALDETDSDPDSNYDTLSRLRKTHWQDFSKTIFEGKTSSSSAGGGKTQDEPLTCLC